MKILYIHQHFATPAGSTGTRSYEFARRWVAAGHKVTVVTGHYDIGGLEYSIEPQYVDGIKVVMVGGKYSNKQSFLRRVCSFVSFMFGAIIAGMKERDVDMVYATSTPLTVGVPAMVLKSLKRVPYIFEVRDQWPEVPVALGILKNPVVIFVARRLEKAIYRGASSIIALSPGMRDGVVSVLGRTHKNVVVAPNCSDIERFGPHIDGSAVRREKRWNGKFIVMHFGSMGKANGLDFLVQAAHCLREHEDIRFVIVGDGATKLPLEKMVEELALDNVEFTGNVPKAQMPAYVAACDVSAVIFADYPILEHNSANKFFDSLAAGKPVLLNYSGWQRELIEAAGAGLGCEQYNLNQFADNLLRLKKETKLLKSCAVKARKLAESKFSLECAASKVLAVLEKHS
ncbi:MAG: glycosyltransferase family 4 protein [Phycisphaerae bacterium]